MPPQIGMKLVGIFLKKNSDSFRDSFQQQNLNPLA